MFFDRGISILGRILVGLLLVVAVVVMTRFLDENTPSHVWLGLFSLPFQLLITYLAILLLRSFQLSSTTEHTLGGIVIGAVMIGYIGAWSGLGFVGTVTGGLLGGVIAHGLATGAVSPILAGAVAFSGLSVLFVPSGQVYGGGTAIPGGVLGVLVMWICRETQRSKSAGTTASDTPMVQAFGHGTDQRLQAALAGSSHFGAPVTRRSPSSVSKIMVAVICCAFFLSGLRKDAMVALGELAFLRSLVYPACGVIVQRRTGGSGILGGAIAGSACYLIDTFVFLLVLYLQSRWDMSFFDPINLVVGPAVRGASIGVAIGALVDEMMRAKGRLEDSRTSPPARERPAIVLSGDQSRWLPRFESTFRPSAILTGVLAGATACMAAGDLEEVKSYPGYAFIVGTWIFLSVIIGFDLGRVVTRSVNFPPQRPA
jgi:hypothetical protein